MEKPTSIDECKNIFIQNNLKTNKNANTTVLQFIADFIYRGRSVDDAINREEIITDLFRSGYCYYFAHILHEAFQKGEICWAAPFGHIIWQYEGIAYDIEGVYTGEATMLIPTWFMGQTINDFKHVPGIINETSEQEIARMMTSWEEPVIITKEKIERIAEMITNKRDQKICDKYRQTDENGKVRCKECPLSKSKGSYDFRCKANSHYNRKEQEWEPDYWEETEPIQMDENSAKALIQYRIDTIADIAGKQGMDDLRLAIKALDNISSIKDIIAAYSNDPTNPEIYTKIKELIEI